MELYQDPQHDQPFIQSWEFMPNTSDSQQQTSINWYPGHMLKAKKELELILKRVDVVLEIRDARIPMTSINHDFEPFLQQKRRIVLFNKTGLADPQITQRWNTTLQNSSVPFIFIDAKTKQNLAKIIPLAQALMEGKWTQLQKKGIRPPFLKLAIIGIPNVGKSSLINRLANHHAASTGPTPGITKHQEWIRLAKNIELLDTPGILWPKFESEEAAFRLAITGAIKDTAVGVERLSSYLIQLFLSNPSQQFCQYYLIPEVLTQQTAEEIITTIAKKRGCLESGGTIDRHRVSEMLLHDFRAGNLGPLTLDQPEEYQPIQSD
ncbi:ribosome biogenesis GTPase YlqF [Deltaproteobacteria bacterium TL4]